METSLRKTLFLVALTLSCAVTVSAKPAPNAGDVAVKPTPTQPQTAVLAARSEPPGAVIRRWPTSAWVLLRSMAPELSEWATFFAAGARKRAAAEAGSPQAVSARDADDLLRAVGTFLAVVETTLGVPSRPMLGVARAG